MCLFPDDYSFGIFFQVEFEDIIADTDLDFRQSHCHRRAFHLGLHLVKVIFVLVYQHHHLAGRILLDRFGEGDFVILAVEFYFGGLVFLVDAEIDRLFIFAKASYFAITYLISGY